ncbi:MAG: ABC transporter ATP-binding protein, partial [Coriobacteriales bacterium]|nr:ABC transporter ATP-binding protein [Coriobacteriales bacterium]
LKPLYKAVSLGGVALIIVLGARNVLGGGWSAWDIAAFTTFMSCFEKLATKSSTAAKLFNAVQKAQVSWRRIVPYLGDSEGDDRNEEAAETDTDPAGSVAPWPAGERCPVAPAHLEVRHLSVSYGDTAVLRDVSFTCEPGQIVGITGAVACGKTTLGRALIGEAPLNGGQIRFGAHDLRELMQAGQPVAGYLGHDPELLSDTVAANVRMGAAGAIEPVLKAVCLDKEVAALPQGTGTVVGDRGMRLSGGQQARLGLARTLFHPRALLVLDDPFSAVDQPTERAIFSQLRAYVAQTGCTILLISHRLSLFPMLDSVVYLQDGRSLQGTHKCLVASCPGYGTLYRLQSTPTDLDSQEAER